jgi:hypothetical protein
MMSKTPWPTKPHSVASLHMDAKNPRLGRETSSRAPRQIIQYLFDHDKALEIARSIATRGYFPNEPLLAVKEDNKTIVIEGNRRLAALKALCEPGLLDSQYQRQVERLARQIEDPSDIKSVAVTIAPSRRATDRQIAGRHVGTSVLPWQAENRASFILDKLAEGYTNDQLQDQLGFSLADIQAARQTRAIADMARSLDLPDEVKARIESPRAGLFTTLERIFDSSVGRDYLMVISDPEHGIRGKTSKTEFLRVFGRLVTDLALGKQSSRSLNKNEDIRNYFEKWGEDRPSKKRGSFVPADIVRERSVASSNSTSQPTAAASKTKQLSKTILPRDLKIRHGNERLKDIRRELVKLKRDDFPNAGAVLLRVFFELTVLDYFGRIGTLPEIVLQIEKKTTKKVPFGAPALKELIPEIIKVAKSKLSSTDALKVEKAIRYDATAPFTISELHGFVHGSDLPSARDIFQFWNRTEPLFRLMLEEDGETVRK